MRKILFPASALMVCLCAGIAVMMLLSCGMEGRGLIQESDLITTIDMGMANAYLVRAGDGFVVIDTGMPMQWNEFESALKKAGALPDKLKLVVLTHGDIDHAGNAASLQKRYGAKIAMHRGDAEMVEKGALPAREIKTVRGRIIMLAGKLMGERNALPLFTPDVLLDDAQSLKAYGLAATVVPLPGHTKGSIALLTSGGDLFIGDMVFNFSEPETPIFVQNDAELKASYSRLVTLDAKTVYPGHGRPFPMERVRSLSL